MENVEQLRDIRSGFAQLPFAQWCKNRMSKHELSSSYNPQSNGHAEQAVKTVKGILKKTDTKQWSPPKPDPELVCTVRAAKLDKKLAQHANRGGMRRESKKKHHDRSAVELEQLEVGCQVVVQDPKTRAWSSKGTIIGERDNGRSYHIELAGGGRQMRNRRQIRPCKAGHMNKNGGTTGHTNKHYYKWSTTRQWQERSN